MATNTYVPLATQTLGSAQSSVTFSSIPQGYTDLVLVVNGSQSNDVVSYLQVGNGSLDTGTNYSTTFMFGDGSSVTSGRVTSDGAIYLGGMGTTGGVSIYNLMNYSNTTTNKTVIGRMNGTNATQARVGLWRSTAAINILRYYVLTGTFNAGTTFSLYGIAAEGTSPAPKAIGGAIYSDATYYYHVFGATGTFTPLSSLTADILVVAGGGGGGTYAGGGGGAGGLLTFTSQALSATGYTVTVGGGGAAGAGSGGNGTNGGDSQFGALTLVKGGGGGGGNSSTGAAGLTGGSGGGAGGNSTGSVAGGSATSGQGNAGGSKSSAQYYGAGGGGAGATGTTISTTVGGAGGVGVSTYSSWGVATGVGQNVSGTYYLAGGGGGNSLAAGGLGGGGASDTGSGAIAGTANTGGGGGGGAGAAGGSGVVIIRYAKV